MTAARYITFEGGEGCGKSTQAQILATALGDNAVLTREPGATAIGASLRGILLAPETGDLDPRTETLLMAADRAQHIVEVVRPALAAGHHVVSDRSVYSSLAYQGHGRGLSVDEIRRVSEWATHGVWPDLVLLLQLARAEDESAVPGEPVAPGPGSLGNVAHHAGAVLHDRFETAGTDFLRRVNAGFRALAAAEPDRIVSIEGGGTVDEVAARVRQVVAERLNL